MLLPWVRPSKLLSLKPRKKGPEVCLFSPYRWRIGTTRGRHRSKNHDGNENAACRFSEQQGRISCSVGMESNSIMWHGQAQKHCNMDKCNASQTSDSAPYVLDTVKFARLCRGYLDPGNLLCYRGYRSAKEGRPSRNTPLLGRIPKQQESGTDIWNPFSQSQQGS